MRACELCSRGTVKKGSVLEGCGEAQLPTATRVRLRQQAGAEALGWVSLWTDVGFPILIELPGQDEGDSNTSGTGICAYIALSDIAVRSTPGKTAPKAPFQSGHYAATIRRGTVFCGLETRTVTLSKTVTWACVDSSQVASHFRGKTGSFHASRGPCIPTTF